MRFQGSASILLWTAAAVIFNIFPDATTTTTVAVEIGLTKEWQVIGENDTVPAGAHIRMDMTTGEKWAKLVDEEDGRSSVEIQADGTSVAVVPDGGGKKEAKKGREEGKEEKRDYDYDMMYRALSHLPEEETLRIGGLPQPPPQNDVSAEERQKNREIWEAKMKDIWERRQKELAELQEDVMDMPEVLKDRIARIKAYLENPYDHLKELHEKSGSEPDEGQAGIVTDIVSVLEDLEYQLSDVDMTRDFHTLGGWTLLGILLSDEVHVTNETEVFAPLVDVVQSHAAWAMGTAVKNTGEFFPYAIEEVKVNGKSTTPLALLLNQLQGNSADVSSVAAKKRQKVLYALGALLRGNRGGQLAFLQLQGPSVLSRLLKESLVAEMALAKRVVTLAGDIASDIVLHDDDGEFKFILDAFSSPDFCLACIESLEYASLREASMRTMQTLAPFCNWDAKAALEAVHKVKRSWQADDPDMDHQVRRELLDLVGDVINRIKND